MSSDLTYSSAFAELQSIQNEIESQKVSVDDLVIKIKRAAALVKFCEEKLRQTSDEVQKVLDNMKDG